MMPSVHRDVVYSTTGERDLLADIYLPAGGTDQRAAIIWVHGGGWRFGDRRLCPDLARYFAQRGIVMVSIDYRLSKQAAFPAALEDVQHAVSWLHTAADDYGIDRARIGLWGGSAGGHLAALCAIIDGAKGERAVAAIADCYGPTDFLQMDAHRDPEGKPSDDAESVQLPKGKRSADADSLESLFLGAPIETVPALVEAANPMAQIRPGAVLPPFLIVHGLADTAVPSHQSELLYTALIRHGGDAQLAFVEGVGHGFTNRPDFDQAAHPVILRSVSGEVRCDLHIFTMIGDWFVEKLDGVRA